MRREHGVLSTGTLLATSETTRVNCCVTAQVLQAQAYPKDTQTILWFIRQNQKQATFPSAIRSKLTKALDHSANVQLEYGLLPQFRPRLQLRSNTQLPTSNQLCILNPTARDLPGSGT